MIMRKSWLRFSLLCIGTTSAVLGLVYCAMVLRRPGLAIVKTGTYDTNEVGQVYEGFMLTNSSARRLVYTGVGFEFCSQSGWSKMEHGKVAMQGRKPYETGMLFGGETLEPRSGFAFFDAYRNSGDARPYRYAALWALPPKDAESRRRWQKWFDAQAIKWLQRPLLLPYGVVHGPHSSRSSPTRRVERTGGSRLAQRQIGRQRRLPPVAHPEC
jgi:hypothetical protein